MRIAYMTLGYPDPGDASSGVFRKVNNQLKTWNKLGHTTHWFAISQLPKTSDEAAHLELSRYQCGNSRMSRFRVCKDVFAGVLAWKPDIIYTRFGSYYPVLSQLMQKIPKILEANTNDLSEYQLMLPKYQFIFHKFTRNWTLNNSAGIVCVASELSELFLSYHKPSCVIGNAIDISDYPIYRAPNNIHPQIVFIASNASPWHGTEKLITIAQAYPDWGIHLIGDTGLEDKNNPPNIYCHGKLKHQDYTKIMQTADVAIAGIAAYTKNANEASALKVREYLAYGIPVILGHIDTDFSDKKPFILNLPNTIDNVDANLGIIENFVLNWMGKRVSRDDIKHLDVLAKESKRLDFFAQVLAQHRSRKV